MTNKGTPIANHLPSNKIKRNANVDKSKQYKESENYSIIATNSRDININRTSSKIRLDCEHGSEKYKKKGEDFPTSSNFNVETMAHKSKLQHKIHEAQNKKASTLNVGMCDYHKMTNELKLQNRNIESVVKKYSRNKLNNHKTKRELDLLNCRLETNDRRTNLTKNNSYPLPYRT